MTITIILELKFKNHIIARLKKKKTINKTLCKKYIYIIEKLQKQTNTNVPSNIYPKKLSNVLVELWFAFYNTFVFMKGSYQIENIMAVFFIFFCICLVIGSYNGESLLSFFYWVHYSHGRIFLEIMNCSCLNLDKVIGSLTL